MFMAVFLKFFVIPHFGSRITFRTHFSLHIFFCLFIFILKNTVIHLRFTRVFYSGFSHHCFIEIETLWIFVYKFKLKEWIVACSLSYINVHEWSSAWRKVRSKLSFSNELSTVCMFAAPWDKVGVLNPYWKTFFPDVDGLQQPRMPQLCWHIVHIKDTRKLIRNMWEVTHGFTLSCN